MFDKGTTSFVFSRFKYLYWRDFFKMEQDGGSEEKQMQYIYRTLGTPKVMGYDNFDTLPHSQLFGRFIKVLKFLLEFLSFL